MRITSQILARNFSLNMNRHLSRIDQFNSEISSGKKLNKPSDDPSGMMMALRVHSRIERNTQYGRNIEDGLGRLGIAENVLNDVKNLVIRARDLAIKGNDATFNSQDRSIIAIEVDQLLEHLLNLANKESVEGYVFGGTRTETTPFQAFRDDQNKITSVLPNGNIAAKVARVVGDDATVEVSADSNGILYGTGDLFETLIELRDGLNGSNPDQIGESMGRLSNEFIDNIVGLIGEIGTRASYMLDRKSELDDDFVQFSEQLSEIEDTDFADAMLQLSQSLAAYEAALLAGTQVLNTTLINALR
jgi:flagellar hook-associated protein 3 FlgL